jgi:hypothetical protein
MVMNIQYITDTKGRKTAVQLPVKDWEKIQKDLEELEKLKKVPKQKLSGRLRGSILKETAIHMQAELEQMRNEWQQTNI